MNIRQNRFLLLRISIHAGGNGYVPPTLCPRSVRADAHVAAYAARAGGAETTKLCGFLPVGHLLGFRPFWLSQVTP